LYINTTIVLYNFFNTIFFVDKHKLLFTVHFNIKCCVLRINVLHGVRHIATYGNSDTFLHVYGFLIATHKNTFSYAYIVGCYTCVLMFVCCYIVYLGTVNLSWKGNMLRTSRNVHVTLCS